MNNNTSPVAVKEKPTSLSSTTTPEKQKAKIPLKTILKNFLNHVDFMEGQRKEGEDLYEKEFQLLKTFSEELRNKSDYACSEGDKDVNKKKNRYKDILPYDYTRVTLSDYPGVPGSDYINANYIKGASGSNAYIACQGPLPHTVNDFWRMVVECEVQVIVMACNEQEAGKYKCECYWTEEGEDRRQYGKFYITLIKSRDICPDFLVRTIKLEWSGEQGKEESRTVCQFHYSAWPDHGIPTQVKPLLEMVRLIRDCQASETLPLLIHCSAGCGRTGTICAIDFVYGLLRSGKISHDFSLYNLVKEMRRQRIAMVQTVDQYVLCHRAVKELFLEQMRVIDSHPYENVGVDGQPLLDGGTRGGRGERGSKGETGMPEYETIFVKGDLDIDKVLSQRSQSVPRTIMGTSILAARGERASPSTTNTTAASGEGGDEVVSSLLPATLEEFSKRPPDPKIHEPPKGPDSSNQTAPQRFKKGNLRLIQTDDGGWRLEEIEDRRRSIEYKPDLVLPGLGSPGDSNDLPKVDEITISPDLSKSEPSLTTAANNTNNQCDKNGGVSPPLPAKRPPSDRRRKKSSKGEDGGSGTGKEVQLLLRRPSIKRIKAFFDKSKDQDKQDKHTAEEKENIQIDKDKEQDEALLRLPRLDNGLAAVSSSDIEGLNLSGSKSVPSSLDRKASNLSKYWPLHSRQSKNEDSQHPLKRSKSMKTGLKPISVIPILNQSSFHDYRNDPPPPSPAPFNMNKKQGSEEFIDLRRPDDGQSNNNSKFFFGDEGSKDSSKKVDLANTRADVGSSSTHHARQSSQELPAASSTADGGFLELQMAKLLARKGIDEMDAAVKIDEHGGGGRKSRDEGGNEAGGGRGGRAVMVVGGGPGGGGRKSLTVLDDDAKQMLKDCQEYLHGQTEYLSVGPDPEAEHSFDPNPSSVQLQYGRSVHSSPGDTYNKYNYRSSSPGAGSLETMGSTPRTSTNYTAETSSMGGSHQHPHTRVGKTRSVSSLNTTSSMLLQSSPPRSKEPSMSSRKTSKTSLDNVENISSGGGEYANTAVGGMSWRQNDTSRLSESCAEEQASSQYCQVTVDAREKLSAAAKSSPGGGVNRERRNSFRKAVDRVDPASLSAADRRTYEQIWMRGGNLDGSDDKDSSVSSGNSPRVTANINEVGESKNINTRTLSNYPVYANAATRTTTTTARDAKDLNVAARGSGSYDNVRIPQDSSIQHEQENQLYKNIPFTVEELSKEDRRQSRTSDTGVPSGDIAGGYEPVNFHNLRINNEKPLDGGYNRGSKTSLLSSTSNPQDLSTRGSKSSILSSASLVAEACRDFERGGRIGLPTPSSQDSSGHKQQPAVTSSGDGNSYGVSVVGGGGGQHSGGYQNAEPQKAATSSAYPTKQSAQKKNSGGGSGSSSVRLPPPYQAPPPGPQYHSGVGSSQPTYHQQAQGASQPPYSQQPPSSTQVGSGGSGQAQHLSSSQSYSSRLTSQVDVTPVRSIGTPVRAPPRSSTKSSPQHHHPHLSSSRHHLPYTGASPAPGQHLPYTSTNTSPGHHHLPYTASRPASSPQQSSHVPDPYLQHTTPLSSAATTATSHFPPSLLPLGANQFTTVTSIGGTVVHRRNPRDANRVRDDSYLLGRSSRDTEAGQAARQMKRNSSLVTMARTGIPDYSGLILKAGNPTGSHSQQTNQPPLIVQGSRTTVQLGGGMSPPNPSPPGGGGGGHHPPGVDIDRVAAAMLTSTTSINERESAPLSQVAAHQGRQLGRSLAGVLSGAAANLKSKLVGGIAVGNSGIVGGRAAGAPSSPSPPRRKEETDSIGSMESRSITAPANLNSQDLGYPVRIKSRPQGPRDTPPSFVKKQEYL